MQKTRLAIDGRAVGLMALLSLIWSFQQVVLKVSAVDMAPTLQLGLRSGLSAVLVSLLIRGRGGTLNFSQGLWRPGLLAGLLFSLEYLMVGEGLRFTTASHMVVFLYTAPIFAALGLAWRLPEERLTAVQWVGIGVAFAGVVVTFFGPGSSAATASAPNILWGDFLGLSGGVSWGATTVVIRCSRLSQAPATQTVFYQLAGAFIFLGAASVFMEQTEFRATPILGFSLAFQVLVVSFASFLVWFWLLRTYLASRLGVLSFMTPLFGVILGVCLLGEPLEPGFLVGSILVLAGIVMVSGSEWLPKSGGRRPGSGAS